MNRFGEANAKAFDLPGVNRPALLLLHGFTGSPGHMRKLGDILSSRGYPAVCPVLPGHCSTFEAMKKASWRDWLACALTEYERLSARYGSVACVGLSMGGVLSLMTAQRKSLAACVTISAPMKAKNPFAPIAAPLSHIMPAVIPRVRPERLKLLDQAYDIGYDRYPTKSVADLNTLMRLARRDLYAVSCPLLVIQSKADETVDPRSLDIILAGAQSKVKESLWLERAPHVATLSDELSKIAEKIEGFLETAVE